MAALAAACESTGRGLHIHVAEDKFDAVDSRYRFGKDICVRLDEAGLLGPKTILGHGLFLTRERGRAGQRARLVPGPQRPLEHEQLS